MPNPEEIKKEFISDEKRTFKFQIGRLLPTGLTGFIGGVIVASIVWFLAIIFLRRFM